MTITYNDSIRKELIDMTAEPHRKPYDPDDEIEAEVCQGTINKLIGYWSAQAFKEREKPEPDLARIHAITQYELLLQRELEQLAYDPGNENLRAKSRYIYAPTLRALFGR